MRCTDAQRLDDGRGRRGVLLRVALTVGAVLATGAVAAGGNTLAGMRAGRATVRADAFAGGSVVLARAGRGAFISFRNVAIGATQTGRLTIVNEGSRAGDLVLSGDIRSSELSRRLRLAISVDGRMIYRGPLAGFDSARAGRIEPRARRTFVFRLGLPSAGSAGRDDALQGESVDASFRWSAAAA